MTRYATIIGTGRYVPETIHTNDMLKQQIDPDLARVVDSFQDSSGILARRLAPREWAASDIAVRAAQDALQAAWRSLSDALACPAAGRVGAGP